MGDVVHMGLTEQQKSQIAGLNALVQLIESRQLTLRSMMIGAVDDEGEIFTWFDDDMTADTVIVIAEVMKASQVRNIMDDDE